MARAMGTSTQQTQRPLEEMCGDLVLAHSLDELAVVTEVRAERVLDREILWSSLVDMGTEAQG